MKLVWIRKSTLRGGSAYIGGDFDSFDDCVEACERDNRPGQRMFPDYVPYPMLVDEESEERTTVEDFIIVTDALAELKSLLGTDK